METKTDPFDKVLNALANYKEKEISVPELARLLGVESPTLNAKFRRQKKGSPVVKGSYRNHINYKTALELALKHEYAIRGYPTIEEVSKQTDILYGTIKARCKKGFGGRKIDARVDLTKKWRIHPEEITNPQGPITGRLKLSVLEEISNVKEVSDAKETLIIEVSEDYDPEQLEEIKSEHYKRCLPLEDKPIINPFPNLPSTVSPVIYTSVKKEPKPKKPVQYALPALLPLPIEQFTLPPPPPQHIRIIKSEYPPQEKAQEEYMPSRKKSSFQEPHEEQDSLIYYKWDNPPRLDKSAVGRKIEFRGRIGTIEKFLDDRFRPQIRACFPTAKEEELRHVNLLVRAR